MDIVISDGAVGRTLVDIVVVDPTRRDWWSTPLNKILSPLQIRSEGRKPTIGITQLGRILCPLLLRHTVHYLIDRIDFRLSVQL